jgi:hypothetical protein
MCVETWKKEEATSDHVIPGGFVGRRISIFWQRGICEWLHPRNHPLTPDAL